jgi:hypothetical protein
MPLPNNVAPPTPVPLLVDGILITLLQTTAPPAEEEMLIPSPCGIPETVLFDISGLVTPDATPFMPMPAGLNALSKV